ncbi:ZrgA family zinc uptake protein [Ferrimonas kyonanensis]|uniref:ZrgA family zinc uptake protein n=1 Tax=Ferrimonas kyonanensis TaxID=364763 RepID=UPI00041EF188|nr:DUF2796 domain-containing protein [Ferrimonas kyonanensis]
MQTQVVFGRMALVLCLAPMSLSSWASEHEHHHHEHHHDFESHQAHVHGAGLLTLVQDQQLLQLSLEVDTHSLWGFEHAPTNADEQQRVAQALSNLEAGHRLFSLSPDAQCQPDGVSVERPLGLDEPSAQDHMDLQVQWQWRCASPAALTQVTVRLFDQFPELSQLTVQRLTPTGSGGGQLDRQHVTLDW